MHKTATRAVSAAFIASGFTFASWASRIPQLRDALDLRPGPLGLVLLASGIGSVLAMPLAGVLVTRFGARATITVMSLLTALSLAIVAVGQTHGVPAVVAGLFFIGIGFGTWDVAMNVEGAAVEQRLERSVMSRFHAGFSIGTVAGALLGAAMQGLGVPVMDHLLGVAVVVAVGVPLAVRGFLPHQPRGAEQAGQPTIRHPLRAWTEPRTLALGVFVLTMAFTEGTGNDWLGLAVIDGYDAPAAVGSLTFAVFLVAMTVGRWFGTSVLDRFGRVKVLRVCGVTALVGLLLVVFGSGLYVAILGAALWGLGTSLGFPVGMSAAADDPEYAAARVSVVSSVGYVAFLAGPPLVGLLGDHVGVLRSLTLVAGMLAVGLLMVGACRPIQHSELDAVRHS